MSADTGLSKHEVLHMIQVGVAADTGNTGLSQDGILHRIKIYVA